MSRITTEIWILKAKSIHGNKYTYDKVKYSSANEKVYIYCNTCKQYFWQRAATHLTGHGCPFCGYENMRKKQRLSINQFIDRAIVVHKDKYDYSNSKYINSSTKIEIRCKRCGLIFYQTPGHHLKGEGCPHCSNINQHNSLKLSIKTFIDRAKVVHKDKYNYDDVIYIGIHNKVSIHCNSCNYTFLQTPANHLQGRGCPICKKINNSIKKIKNSKILFFQKVYDIHKNRYDYSKSHYNGMRKKIEIICNKCYKSFFQVPMSHLRGNGCPYCNQSKGEIQIQDWLNLHSIKYIAQKRFKNCKDKKPLPFDFYLPEHNICIEFQGQQHYSLEFFINKYKKNKKLAKEIYNNLKKHDRIKKEYCRKNKINLIEIKYNQDIDNVLFNFIKIKKPST